VTAVDSPPAPRPFYGEFAWAYDHLVARPVDDECAAMAATLHRRGIGPGARVLDAGCGNGRYAVGLARRGFAVTGVDRSPGLLDEARVRVRDAALPVQLEAGDLLALPAHPRYDAIVCRGVLNDLVDHAERGAVFEAFARALRPGGALLFDVREWAATAAGKGARPIAEKRVSTPRGLLVFRTETRLDPATRRMLIAERHTLTTATGHTVVATHDFVMRCWTREELEAILRRAGFEATEYAATYDGAPAGAGDRLVVVASHGTGTEGRA
jgi:SAM-dependent methyltransferase